MTDIKNLDCSSEKRIKAALDELNESNVQLEEMLHKYQKKEKFTGMSILGSGIAQQLGKPLNLIFLNLNFIEKNIEDDSPVYGYIDSIKSELERIKTISEQLENLSQPAEEDMEEIDLVNLLESLPLKNILIKMKKRGYTINTDYQSDLPCIKAARSSIIEVFMLLINNAEDAMPGGIGELTIELKIIQKEEIKYISILIEDSGEGIPPDKLQRIFEPFFSTKGKSSGLGLVIVYSIIANLGGSIGVRSTPGVGTTFKILLPAYSC